MADIHSTDNSSDDEKKVMDSSWERMKNIHLIDGFREGAIAGKDKQFQLSFDHGYTSAFQESFQVGYNSGAEKIRLFLLKKVGVSDGVQRFQNSLDRLCTTCQRK